LILISAWFLDPLPLEDYWLLLLFPLVLAISVVYKAIKIENLSQLPWQATVMAGQIIAFMVGAAVLLWLVSEVIW